MTSADLASPAGGNPMVPPLPTDLDLAQTFLLASRPGATKTIFLDFDGHTTSRTYWNSNYTRGRDIVTPAYSIDGDDSTFSDVELATIQCIWQRVAEDFAPFDINVTTAEPASEDLRKYGTGDDRWGMRVNIGGSYMDWLYRAAGGIAVRSSFGQSRDLGVFVFTEHRLGEEKYTADSISHEVGHTLGLAHKGGPGTAYYSGHGAGETGWAPLMGAAYNRPLSQWSKGEYPGATNRADELKIITTGKGVNYRPDDFGNSRFDATALPIQSLDGDVRQVSFGGVIERNTDQDWFVFATTGGSLSLDFLPISRGANLDVLAGLYSADGDLIATSNPADRISASLNLELPAGVYYVMVDGVGARGLADGYSDYGSLGQYTIRGTIAGSGVDPAGDPSAASWITGSVWHDINGNGAADSGDQGLAGIAVFLDTNADGLFDPDAERSARTDDSGRYVFWGLAPGEYSVHAALPESWRQLQPAANEGHSVSLTSLGIAPGINFSALQPPEITDPVDTIESPVRSTATFLSTQAVVHDLDSTSFADFRLTAQWTTGAATTDRLFIKGAGTAPGQVSLAKSSVRYGGRVIGKFAGGTGGVPLSITFNAAATLDAISAVTRSIAYRTTTLRPVITDKTVAFSIAEANGVLSNVIEKRLTIVAG
ncbi:MAG TPA: SdrD B-like domain-containing protein [Caulifigura sp.]|nr:SdrD B-like domain-containing protein [Caulifigura sp.]